MEQQPVALLLAGGFATRLWPLTEKRAKPLLPLAGKQLIRHILDKIPGEMKIIISTNKAFEEAFLALKEDYPNREIDVFIEDSLSDRNKVGALAATSLVIQEYDLKTPLLLVAGDNYFGFSIDDFLAFYGGKTLLASYDTKSLQTAKQFGVVEVEGKKLISFVEKPEDPPSTLISTGCYLFEPAHLPEIVRFARISADNLGGIFEHLLQQNKEVEVFAFDEQWIDIGSFESYLQAHKLLLPENSVHPSSNISHSELGNSVEIGAHCEIENSFLDQVIIMDGCKLKNVRLRGCVIDKNCVIEGVDLDHKMIREHSVIKGVEVEGRR